MTKTVLALVVSALACSALAENGVPTPADNTTSVLAKQSQPQPVPAATDAESAPAATPACAEAAKEVRLGPWQARRIARQADRQEARAACECCNCDCRKNKDCRPTVLVLTKVAPKCACGCK